MSVHTPSPLPPPPPQRPPPTTRYSWRNIHPNTTLHYIKDVEQADLCLEKLQGPVGFDLEWKPTFKKGAPENPVALVQLANKDTIMLIQISAMKEFPPKLRDFLENPDFVKAGVAIQNDVKKLYNDCNVSTRNCVDLSLLARSVDNAQWKGKYSNPLGLARLIEAYEDLLLPKGRITRSNWEDVLSPQQIEYAGNDAHAGLVIYERLMRMGSAMEKPPKTTYYTFDAVRGRLCEPTGMQWFSYNPDYDPGPPPPPKPPKPPTARDLRRAAAVASPPSAAQQGPGTSLIMSAGSPSARYTLNENPGSQRNFSSPAGINQAIPLSSTRPTHPYSRSRHVSPSANQGSLNADNVSTRGSGFPSRSTWRPPRGMSYRSRHDPGPPQNLSEQ